MKRLFIAVVTLSVIGLSAQSPVGSGLSPRDVVDRLWKEATEGELLAPEGWNRTSRFFAQHDAFPENSAVRIVSNSWGLEQSSVSNDTAQVVMEYGEAGTVDVSLRYTPPPKTAFYKNANVFHLVLAPTHWTMFKSDGKTLTPAEERTGPTEWQIQERIGLPWTTVNTAIRYVLEKREKATDPAIKKNANETIGKLLKLQ
jgi:hypothetical protein